MARFREKQPNMVCNDGAGKCTRGEKNIIVLCTMGHIYPLLCPSRDLRSSLDT